MVSIFQSILSNFLFVEKLLIFSICITDFLFVCSLKGAAQYPNNLRIQEYAAKNLKIMDAYPDESEKMLNAPHMKQRMLEAEKKIAVLKSKNQNKSTK